MPFSSKRGGLSARFITRRREDTPNGMIGHVHVHERLSKHAGACENFQEHDQLDRWMADGLYEVSRFVRDWTSHPDFPRPEPEQYYSDCVERLDDLADWFFRGFHSYIEPHRWADL